MDVFLVEDEAIIRMMIAEMVVELGHRVIAEAGTLERAELLAQCAEVDLGILDINLAGRNSFPIAEVLVARQVPFLFASGYGDAGLHGSFRQRPVLRKPFLIDQLARAIESTFSS